MDDLVSLHHTMLPDYLENTPQGRNTMTEIQYKVERSKLDLIQCESRVREAQAALDESQKKLQADMELQLSRLREELERAKTHVQIELNYLKFAESEMERGFSS